MQTKKLKRDQIRELEVTAGIKTAILVDGSFFLKRYRHIYPPPYEDAVVVAKNFYSMVHGHVEGRYLYRIFYYDCTPFDKKVLLPISQRNLDYSKTSTFRFRLDFFNELRRKRKVALRLGTLSDSHNWIIRPQIMKDLLLQKIKLADITDDDLFRDLKQKGIDMKIGCDIASLAYKKLVHQIVLISGDSDFVPAAKVARREGIDFILDPMWNHIQPDIFEHIDGLKSVCPKPSHIV